MKILFLSHYFPPEVNAPANRTFEHCREWVKAGHEVHVITCVPSHPIGKPFAGYKSRWYRREDVEGIVVHRVWTYLAPNSGVAKRTLNYLSFIPSAVWRAMRLGTFDMFIGTSPQFFCAVATWIAARLKRTPWVFELRDIWPESIPAVGAARAYMPLRWLERLELRMYRAAQAVVCVSEAFIPNLQRRGIDLAKLHFVPNGIDPAFWASGSREKGRQAIGASDGDVVVSYVGTVGMAHDVGTILESADRLRSTHPHIKFLIVGDGAELTTLRARANAESLSNVQFTGLVKRERIPDYLAATDISLVTLKRSEVFKSVLPSKMFEAMAAGTPIVLGVEGEAKRILERAGAGLPIAPGDSTDMTRAILQLAQDHALRATFGRQAVRFVERAFSRRTWGAQYLRILEDLRGRSAPSPRSRMTSSVLSARS